MTTPAPASPRTSSTSPWRRREVNREQKRAYDAAEWLPALNRCWYADRIVQVRRKYALTIDHAEADALERVLSGCASVEMVVR